MSEYVCFTSKSIELEILKNYRSYMCVYNIYIYVNPKIGVVSPQIIHFNRLFHEINHPFWGKTPIFGNTPIYKTFGCSGYWFLSVLKIRKKKQGSPKPRCSRQKKPISWVVPLPRLPVTTRINYYIFSSGSRTKPSFATGILGGVVPTQAISVTHHNIPRPHVSILDYRWKNAENMSLVTGCHRPVSHLQHRCLL